MRNRTAARPALRLATLSLALAAATAAGAHAQVITFDPADFPDGPTTPIPDGYGSTPGLATTYRSLDAFGDSPPIGDMRWWDGGHGSLFGVAYGVNRTASVAEVGLRATGAGGPVTLHDFDIGSWSVISRTLFVQVLGWDYSLIHEIEAPIGTEHFSFASYLTGVGASAPMRTDGFRIQWTQDRTPTTPEITGRGAYDAGIDNIAFDAGAASVVPEPSTVVLLGSGLAGLLVARRMRGRGRTEG